MADENEKQPKSNPIDRLKGKGWKPGQSGNPKGRPKKEICITSLVKEHLEKEAKQHGRELLNEDGTKKTWSQIVAEALVAHFIKGNPTAIKEVLDRVDGKVPDKLEASGPGGGPIEFKDSTKKRLRDAMKDARTRETILKLADRLYGDAED